MGVRTILVFCCIALLSQISFGKKISINHDDDSLVPPPKSSSSQLQVGLGIWDMTGPAAEVGMMGYAMVNQITWGIHYRLRARAFIAVSPVTNKRIVFVSTDSGMIFTSVKLTVVQKLQALYGSLYTKDNVLLSGTHTHSGPAGFAYHPLYDLTSFGFKKDNFDCIVNGIVAAIKMAHDNLVDGKILINNGTLYDSNRNRSPTAYLFNPAEERQKYENDTDTTMTLLKFMDTNGGELGAFNWFAVHGTSMNNTNRYISGDNKGYAAYLFEKLKNGKESIPGFGPFIAAFAQSNEGDVSPNTRGAFCPDGTPCDSVHSTCGGATEGCIASGPGKTDEESNQIIGTKQFNKAVEIYNSAAEELKPVVDYIHTYVDMSDVVVSAEFTSTGKTEKTCTGALGDSFAAGTTDGPGDFNFIQGNTTNPYWNFLGSFLSDPTPEQIACQAPKPILLNTGGIDIPAPWTPKILSLQIFRIGQLFLIGVPGEFTTMSGRRLRDAVRKVLVKNGVADENSYVVIAGLSNDYSHYITTYEEFQAQRYEGASTLFGPHTLSAYIQEYSKLAQALATGTPVPPGPTPPDLSGSTFDFLPGVLFDSGNFGSLYQDANAQYSRGDAVQVIFYGAHPRNNFRIQDTFLTVERLDSSNNWKVVRTDGDWSTKYRWARRAIAESLITITWNVEADAIPGTYRIRHFGNSKDILAEIFPYEGTSRTFTIN